MSTKHKKRRKYDPDDPNWDKFRPELPIIPGTKGVPADLESNLEAFDIAAWAESMCGTTDESQEVEQYDGTLGVTQAFVADHERPVGQIQWNADLGTIYDNPGTMSGARWCSGTLISCNLFLTAGHCFDQISAAPRIDGTTTIIPPDEIATNMHVNFNYQFDPAGTLRAEVEFAIVELVEYRLNGLDYAVVRLDGNPGSQFGVARVSQTDPEIDEMLCIIGHPVGLPKRIEAGPLTDVVGDFLRYDDIDTFGGNSGSGVLGDDGTIKGVHTNGGCDLSFLGYNSGVRIESILAASPVVSDIVQNKSMLVDNNCRIIKFKFSDDTGVIIKVIRDDPKNLLDPPKNVFDPPKAIWDPPKNVFDPPPKIIKDPPKNVFDPPKAVWDPPKSISDPPKSIFDPVKQTQDPPKMKNIDDVKTAGYDLGQNFDIIKGQPVLRKTGRSLLNLRGGTPFVLSTPHHYNLAEQGRTPSLSKKQQQEELKKLIELKSKELKELEDVASEFDS